jgi:hypothetical protein
MIAEQPEPPPGLPPTTNFNIPASGDMNLTGGAAGGDRQPVNPPLVV